MVYLSKMPIWQIDYRIHPTRSSRSNKLKLPLQEANAYSLSEDVDMVRVSVLAKDFLVGRRLVWI